MITTRIDDPSSPLYSWYLQEGSTIPYFVHQYRYICNRGIVEKSFMCLIFFTFISWKKGRSTLLVLSDIDIYIIKDKIRMSHHTINDAGMNERWTSCWRVVIHINMVELMWRWADVIELIRKRWWSKCYVAIRNRDNEVDHWLRD